MKFPKNELIITLGEKFLLVKAGKIGVIGEIGEISVDLAAFGQQYRKPV
jgi:hypothetical protein